MASIELLSCLLIIFCFDWSTSGVELGSVDPYAISTFTVPAITTLNHFAISEDGSIFVAGVDVLYRLSPELDVTNEVNISSDMPNINKILAIVPEPVNRLITCGSGLNQTCQLRNLTSLDQEGELSTMSVAPGRDTTVGIVISHEQMAVASTVRKNGFSDDVAPVAVKCLHTESGCSDRGTNELAGAVHPTFIIEYATAFSYDGFTYFLASQRLDATASESGSPVAPKLSRVCQNDTDEELGGFTEVTLECEGSDGISYNIAKSAYVYDDELYAVFVGNGPDSLDNLNPTNRSALCVYNMDQLIAEFDAAIINCSCTNTGTGNFAINNWLNRASCKGKDDFLNCSTPGTAGLPCTTVTGRFARYPERKSDMGAFPGEALFIEDNESFSSVFITSVDEPIHQLVGFIGTSGGHLLKVRLSDSASVLYEKLELSYSVLSDIQISEDKEHITVLTEKQLLKLTVANCSQFLTCDECIKPGTELGDPYCGWCTLEAKCTRYHECTDSNGTDRWLYYNEDTCVQIMTAEPASLSVNVGQQMVKLRIPHLPLPMEFSYSCHFGDFTTPASYDNNILTCESPPIGMKPAIPMNENSIAVELSLSTSNFDVKFVTSEFYFFDCSRISSCIDCVTLWDCDWCIDDLECTYSRSSPCLNISSSETNAGATCPHLTPDTIYVPADVDMEIQVNASNLNLTEDSFNRTYECVVTAEDGTNTFMTEASLEPGMLPDTFDVNCSTTQYTYPEEEQEKSAVLSLRWKGEGIFLDGTVQVTLYKCAVDRPDCSRCLSEITTPPELDCHWCDVPGPPSCVYMTQCGAGGITDTCETTPVIKSVFPPSGPIEGGTLVEINGTDLGLMFGDIDNITLAGITCDHSSYSDLYAVGESVTCKAGRSENVTTGSVAVKVRSTSEGDIVFSYNNPNITNVFPIIGPISGGTIINITGTNLDTGRNIRVLLDNLNCTINSMSSDAISCTNMPSPVGVNTSIMVLFDDIPRMAQEKFTFYPDPTVSAINPKRAIKSGGNQIQVRGTGFDLIQRPQIQFTVGDTEKATGPCVTVTAEEMNCRSPNLNSTRRKRADEAATEVNVGFIMDGVTDLLTWSADVGVTLELVADPEYREYPNGIDYDTNLKRLELNGTNLNLVDYRSGDVIVYIGSENCMNVGINTPTQLICSPPNERPPAGDIYGGRTDRDLPFVIVQHGNLEFNIGYIRYIVTQDITLYIVLPAVAVLLLILLVMLLFMWHIRRQKASKISDLELQVREIQDSVSGNLKSLFATLQTTAEDFDAVLDQMKAIPLLGRRQYLLNMLFLGLHTKPPTEPSETSENPDLKTAMERFSTNLLSKKNFLEVLIRSLDQSSNIGFMDKVNIASLLSVCLLQDGKQELLTTVIIGLMREQIEDCDSKAQKCRILFSRSETVLEKLISNWVTVFQYRYLENHAAKPLHHLFHAIKYVCEMGPIDAVTGKSQFSINDQQMLETQIVFNELVLTCMDNVSGEKNTISALDVNTITQVKQRIISFGCRNIAFSGQPDPYVYDLMWRTGKGGQLILRDDDDLPGNTENEWRKLNTMADFNVTSELANFELIERQANPNATMTIRQDSHEGTSEANGRNKTYEAVASRHTSFNPAAFPAGTRPWHLVRDLEDEDDKHAKPKEIKEVVLPFLPATRNYIQKYVDSFFEAVLADQSDDVSPAIQYLFQFFDRESDKQERPDYAKAWKDNVLTLRYWTTILASPQYALDLGIHSYTSACLRTLVQVVKDTCAGRSKPNKTDFSPSRLLYSSVIPGYISKLANFYLHVRDMGRVTSEDMAAECQQVEQDFAGSFDLLGTQYELFKMLETYKDMLKDALEADDVCQEADMAAKLQAVSDELSGDYMDITE